jgi:hypothetical protein
MASSQAFMEYLKKSPRLSHVPEEIGRESGDVSGAIEHYRKLYQPVENQAKEFDGVISERLFQADSNQLGQRKYHR